MESKNKVLYYIWDIVLVFSDSKYVDIPWLPIFDKSAHFIHAGLIQYISIHIYLRTKSSQYGSNDYYSMQVSLSTIVDRCFMFENFYTLKLEIRTLTIRRHFYIDKRAPS